MLILAAITKKAKLAFLLLIKKSAKSVELIKYHQYLGIQLEKNEPRHEISNNVICATSKASDQPAHTRSLIRAFARRLNIL